MLNNMHTKHKLGWLIAYNETSYAKKMWQEFQHALTTRNITTAKNIRIKYKQDFIKFNKGA